MMAVTHNFIVWDSPHAKLMAERWAAEFDAKRQEMYIAMADLPDEAGIVRAMVDINIHKGLDIRAYQKHVIETYDYFQMHTLDDDLIEQLANGTESSDMHDIIETLKEFQTNETNFDVASMIPLDFKGTMGFVIQSKLR